MPLLFPSLHTPSHRNPLFTPSLFFVFLGATVPHASPQKIFPEKIFQKNFDPLPHVAPPTIVVLPRETLPSDGRCTSGTSIVAPFRTYRGDLPHPCVALDVGLLFQTDGQTASMPSVKVGRPNVIGLVWRSSVI